MTDEPKGNRISIGNPGKAPIYGMKDTDYKLITIEGHGHYELTIDPGEVFALAHNPNDILDFYLEPGDSNAPEPGRTDGAR